MSYNEEEKMAATMKQGTQAFPPHAQIFQEGLKIDEALDSLEMLLNKISSCDVNHLPADSPPRPVPEVSLHDFLHGEAGAQDGRCERLRRLIQAFHSVLFE